MPNWTLFKKEGDIPPHPNTPESRLLPWCMVNLNTGVYQYRPNRSSTLQIARTMRRQGFEVRIDRKIGEQWQHDVDATTEAYKGFDPHAKSQLAEEKAALRFCAQACKSLAQSGDSSNQAIDALLESFVRVFRALEITPEELDKFVKEVQK